jgi:ADP-ribose pyrophosphatase YjhB (NUDIX family)
MPKDGDNKLRAICQSCGNIHYQNPLIVVGTITQWNNKVLLCLRNIEPRKGLWTLPAGFLELGETSAQGAIRETMEEAGINVKIGCLFSMLDVVHAGQIHLFFHAYVDNETLDPGYETAEAAYFSEDEIPWENIAFRTVSRTLKAFFENKKGQVLNNPAFLVDSITKTK